MSTLAEYGKKGTIKIYLSEITREEVKSNIKEDLSIVIQQINQFKKEIHRKGRIIRNIEGFKEYLNLPKLNARINFEKITSSLDTFIQSGNVNTIPTGNIDIKPILHKYFNKEKPFGEGKKKFEFPDAIFLASIENWCKENHQKTYLVSSDTDILEYKSDYIFPLENIGKLLGTIHRMEVVEKERFEWIEQIFIKSWDRFTKVISEHFIERIKDEYYSDINVRSVRVLNIEYFDFSIIDDSVSFFTLQMDVDISYSLDFSYTDYGSSYYDKEDDKWFFKDIKTAFRDFDDTITVEIEIEAEFDERNDPNQDIGISCIYTSIPDEDKIENSLIDY